MNRRIALSIVLPFAAGGLQWLLWAHIQPYVWFLFFPAAYFSAWIGGLRGGLAGTAIGALLVWYVFIPPAFDLSLEDPANAFSIVVFVVMGSLFAFFFERLRQAQARSETRFEATFEQAAVGIALVTPDGHWLRVNRKLCDIVGYRADELMSSSFQDITHPDDLSTDLELVNRVLAGEISTYTLEKRYRRQDGSIIWINLSVALVRTADGAPDYFISIVEDIQARKEAEANLNEAQRLAKLGHWHWDLRTNRHAWSEEIYRIYGRDPALPPAVYPEVQSCFTPDSWTALSAAVENALANGLAYECDAEVVRPDGTNRWITARGEAVRDAGGKVVALRGTVQDITERRQAEERLHLWAESFEHAQVGLAISDARSNTFAAVNPAFARERGYTPDELAGQPITLIFPPEKLPDFWHRIAEAEADSHGVFESEHQCRDGHRFPVLLDVTVLRDSAGHPVNRVVYALDLTERKRVEQALAAAQAEAMEQQNRARLATLNQMQDANAARARAEAALTALHESQEQLKLFVEHAPASLAMFDREMRYLAVSRRWLNEYALGDRDVLGGCHYEIFPEIGDDWKSVHRRGLAGEVVYGAGDRFERTDGSVHWIRWEVRPWNTADGAVGGIVIFSEDITRQKEAEEEIRRLNTDLERRVVERTAELSAANRELDSFAYAVSHDLRAPLRAMSGFSQALLEDYGGQLADEARKYLDQIGIASHRMSELIDGILALSRSTRGDLRRDQVDISALASQRLAALSREDASRQVNWQVAPGITLTGDAPMIEAVLENLLDNAWKYTGKTAAPEIRVYAEQRDGQPWLCVADNGAGFDMAHAERLFKPFQRLHRQDEFPGIGIGLATVQRIVHRHGGEIGARGEPGRGAIFCFTLPAAAASEESE